MPAIGKREVEKTQTIQGWVALMLLGKAPPEDTKQCTCACECVCVFARYRHWTAHHHCLSTAIKCRSPPTCLLWRSTHGHSKKEKPFDGLWWTHTHTGRCSAPDLETGAKHCLGLCVQTTLDCLNTNRDRKSARFPPTGLTRQTTFSTRFRAHEMP